MVLGSVSLLFRFSVGSSGSTGVAAGEPEAPPGLLGSLGGASAESAAGGVQAAVRDQPADTSLLPDTMQRHQWAGL